MKESRNSLLNEIYFKTDIQENLAKKYGISSGYVSQLAKKLTYLKVPPEHNEKVLQCANCLSSEGNLVFHHNHNSGELIALVCHSCNLKLRNKDLNGMILYEHEETNEVHLGIRIDMKTKEKLQIEAKKEDLTTSQLIRKLINIFLGED